MNELNHYPLLRLLIPFIIGAISAVYYPFNQHYSIILFSIFFLSLIVLTSIKKINSNFNIRWIFGVHIYLLFFLLGNVLTLQKSNQNQHTLANLNDQLVIGEIAEPPIKNEKTVKCVLTIKGTKNNPDNYLDWKSVEGKAIVFLEKNKMSEQLNNGDYISFQPEFKDVPNLKNPLQFDYKKYLSFHLINQQSYLKSSNWKLLHQENHNNMYAFADLIRRKMIFTLEQLGLSNNELGVASALILGYTNNIEAQLKSAYSSSGAMHILSVSGLHVAIIFMLFNGLLKFLDKIKYGSYVKGVLLLLILWCYALLTGLSPSVLRSAAMFSFVIVGKALNKKSSFFNTLSASALLLLLINPFLVFDVGFQLSYAAVAGIVLMQPLFGNFYTPKTWLGNYIWELITVSIAAQIATFPLALYYFHQFPNYFLVANLFVIPLSLGILIVGVFTLAFSFIPQLALYLGIVLKYLVFGLNWIVLYIDQLPYSLTNNIKMTLVNVFIWYCIIACIILLIIYRKFNYFLGASLLSLLLLFSIAFDKYHLLNQKKFMVYNIPKHTAINFIDGDDNILVSDIKLSNDKVKFHVQNNWIDKGIKSEKVVNLEQLKKEHLVSNIYKIDNKNLFTKRNYFQYYGYKIGVVDKNFTPFSPTKKIAVDVLIWTQNCKIPLEKITKLYDFNLLIIDSSNSTYVNDKLVTACGLLKLECWSVLNDGAYGIDL